MLAVYPQLHKSIIPGFESAGPITPGAGSTEHGNCERQRFDHFYVTYTALIDGLGLGIGPMSTLENSLATDWLQPCDKSI
jgi:hypothetical protein